MCFMRDCGLDAVYRTTLRAALKDGHEAHENDENVILPACLRHTEVSLDQGVRHDAYLSLPKPKKRNSQAGQL